MLLEQIKNFIPYNEQEETDKKILIDLLESGEELFLRENQKYHFTASAWVLNKEHTKVLMAYHNLYDSWAWLGGHADGERDLLKVAIKEVQEESGLTEVSPVSEDIYSLEILTVNGHMKKGKYVASHLHLNVTFLMEADETLPIFNKPDENKMVGWFEIEEAIEASSEEWFKEWIYKKLNGKLSENN